MLKNCFFGCCYALLYSNAFKFNLYEILEVKVIWRPCQRSHVSCLSTFSKGFCSETTGSISFKFHMQSSSKGGKKVYIFDPGHMTKLVAMPIYGKNLKKNLWPTKTVLMRDHNICFLWEIRKIIFELSSIPSLICSTDNDQMTLT